MSINVQGILSGKRLKQIETILNYERQPNEIVLVCDYSVFDIPLNYCFDKIYNLNNQAVIETSITLKGVTDGFGNSLDLIFKGHKSVANFYFSDYHNIEYVRSFLSIVDGWQNSQNILKLCSSL